MPCRSPAFGRRPGVWYNLPRVTIGNIRSPLDALNKRIGRPHTRTRPLRPTTPGPQEVDLRLACARRQLLRANVVQRADVRVVQAGDGLGFTSEALLGSSATCSGRTLMATVRSSVTSLIHFSHAASPGRSDALGRAEGVRRTSEPVSEERLLACSPSYAVCLDSRVFVTPVFSV